MFGSEFDIFHSCMQVGAMAGMAGQNVSQGMPVVSGMMSSQVIRSFYQPLITFSHIDFHHDDGIIKPLVNLWYLL